MARKFDVILMPTHEVEVIRRGKGFGIRLSFDDAYDYDAAVPADSYGERDFIVNESGRRMRLSLECPKTLPMINKRDIVEDIAEQLRLKISDLRGNTFGNGFYGAVKYTPDGKYVLEGECDDLYIPLRGWFGGDPLRLPWNSLLLRSSLDAGGAVELIYSPGPPGTYWLAYWSDIRAQYSWCTILEDVIEDEAIEMFQRKLEERHCS